MKGPSRVCVFINGPVLIGSVVRGGDPVKAEKVSMSEKPGYKKLCRVLLLFIIGSAAVLRLYGVHFGLPYTYQQDEPTIVRVAMHVASGSLNPDFFNYPSLYIYFTVVLLGGVFLVGKIMGIFAGLGAFEAAYWCDPTLIYITLRIFVALIGTLVVYFSFRLGKKAFSKWIGLAAALFMACSFLHIRVSHFAIMDVPMGLLLLISFIFVLDIYWKGSHRAYILSGLFSGLATSTKYNGSLIVICILIAHLFYLIESGRLSVRTFFGLPIWKSALAFLCAFALTSPFAVIDFSSFVKDFMFEVNHMQTGHPGFMVEQTGYSGWAYHLRYSLFYGVGPFVLGVFFISLARAVIKRHKKNILIYAFPVIYIATIGFWNVTWDRYLVPTLPFICYGAAESLGWITNKMRTGAQKVALAVILIVPAVFLPLSWAVRFDSLLQSTDTRTEAAEWIRKNVAPNTFVAVDAHGLQLKMSTQMVSDIMNHAQESGASPGRKVVFLSERPELTRDGYRLVRIVSARDEMPLDYRDCCDIDRLYEIGVRYVVIGRFTATAAIKGSAVDPRLAELGEFYNRLRKEGSLVKEFLPYDDVSKVRRFSNNGHDIYFPFYPLSPFAGGVDKMGTEQEIYELKGDTIRGNP